MEVQDKPQLSLAPQFLMQVAAALVLSLLTELAVLVVEVMEQRERRDRQQLLER